MVGCVHDRGSMHCRGCVAGGMRGGGACMAGMCMAGGMHGRGMCGRGVHGRSVCVAGGRHALQGACMTGEMVTAVEGMHPTRMHSCLMKFTHYSKGWLS